MLVPASVLLGCLTFCAVWSCCYGLKQARWMRNLFNNRQDCISASLHRIWHLVSQNLRSFLEKFARSGQDQNSESGTIITDTWISNSGF